MRCFPSILKLQNILVSGQSPWTCTILLSLKKQSSNEQFGLTEINNFFAFFNSDYLQLDTHSLQYLVAAEQVDLQLRRRSVPLCLNYPLLCGTPATSALLWWDPSNPQPYLWKPHAQQLQTPTVYCVPTTHYFVKPTTLWVAFCGTLHPVSSILVKPQQNMAS